MDDQRRKIITNEIMYWKQNRLLPAHYCDFLLNLYTEGTAGAEPVPGTMQNRPAGMIRISLIGLLLLSVFLFYFTELSLFLQITLTIFFGFSALSAGLYMLKNSLFDLIPLLSSALLLLITSVQVVEIIFPDKPVILYLVTAANCLLWLAAGSKLKMVSFKLSGIAGLLVLLIVIFR